MFLTEVKTLLLFSKLDKPLISVIQKSYKVKYALIRITVPSVSTSKSVHGLRTC